MTKVTPMNQGSRTLPESPSCSDLADRDRIRAERVAQGLPPTISSPESLAMIAAAVRATLAERAA
jgi:hypothetical protein